MISSAVALRMEGVSKAYPGTLAVDAVDFEARVGEVHALMGENGAGKSTLMKMLAGSFCDYTGRIAINGKEVKLHSPALAKAHGVGMIYQELSLARPISIAENLLVGRLPSRFGFMLDRPAMMEEASRCLERVGLDLDPKTPVDAISQHEAQLVEVAKVLGNDPSILVMDEPTSALSRDETERLFAIMRKLKKAGLTIIYISHHLSEIFAVADRVTVLRDGQKIATRDVGAIAPSELVQMMVGEKIDEFYRRRTATVGRTVLKVRNLTRRGFFHDVSLHVKEGEIVGIAGLAGAGRTEVARSLCGLDPVDAGTVELDGRPLRQGSYEKAAGRGLYYLSEDRKRDGLFLRLSLRRNLLSALIAKNTTAGFHSDRRSGSTADAMIEELEIVAASPAADVGNLSGGNQQKALLGKWLAAEPRVLVLDEPTRGVDVKAKKKIHEAVIGLADRSKGIVLISSDLPELVGLSDRVVVMRTGRITGELSGEALNEESVLLAANGEREP